MKYIIANWKANKDLDQTKTWVSAFLNLLQSNKDTQRGLENNRISIIICPPYPFIYPLKELFKNYVNIEIGSQNVSRYDDGTYTGEVTAHNLSSLVKYAIVGHSERTKYFHETVEDSLIKLQKVKQYGIVPIYCVPKFLESYPSDPTLLCYEPPNAISNGDGRGNNVSPADIYAIRVKMNLSDPVKFIYGGSVNKDNVKGYLKYPDIDGVLLGGASLEPEHLFSIVSIAVSVHDK